MFRYKDDVLSLNNLDDRIYPIEPEIKDTRDTDRSYLEHIKIQSKFKTCKQLEVLFINYLH
jgi:hypothetical protein